MRDDFDRVLCGPSARGLYESNYLKANDPSGQGALWLKYNLMAPLASELPRSAELWAVIWAGPGRRPLVFKQVVTGPGLETSERALAIRTPAASLEPGRARGVLDSAGHRVSWDLVLSGRVAPIFHVPHEAMYRLPFPKKKIMTPRPRLRFDGHVTVDGVERTVDGWVGLRGHNWGAEHPHSYAYCNANLWDQPGRWAFDAFSGRIPLGPLVSPWLSAAVLRTDSRELRLNGLARLVNGSARVEFPSWSCTFRCRGTSLRVRATLEPEDVAGLRYLNPDGRLAYCYNTKFARLELVLRRKGRRVERRTSSLAELEFLGPEPIPGIPLHGDDVLPRA